MADGKIEFDIVGNKEPVNRSIDEVKAHAAGAGDDIKQASEETSQKIGSDFNETQKKVSENMDATGNKAQETAKKIGAAFTAASAAIVALGYKSVEAASDLNEVQNVVDTTFGEGAAKINDWAVSAGESFGESELQAKQFTSTLGAMFKSMGVGQADMEEMSMALAGLSGDMASFYNLDPTEAFEKLRSGISGETEPLKQLGINMSVANLEAYALSQGITKSYDSMDQAAQATLRYQFIMQATSDAQGDFSKTSDSFANQQRILKLELQELAAEIGQDLLPVAVEIIDAVRSAIEWGKEHRKTLEFLGIAILGVTAGFAALKAEMAAEKIFSAVSDGIRGVTIALGLAETGAGLFSAALSMLPAVAVVAGLVALVAAIKEVQDAQEQALATQYEYMDSLVSLADLQANGDLGIDGGTSASVRDQISSGKYSKTASAFLGAQSGRTSESFADIAAQQRAATAGRYASGEDFVGGDWTPAYLDYGERVLTRENNIKFDSLGGLQGMERALLGPQAQATAPAPQKVGVDITFKDRGSGLSRFLDAKVTEGGGLHSVNFAKEGY